MIFCQRKLTVNIDKRKRCLIVDLFCFSLKIDRKKNLNSPIRLSSTGHSPVGENFKGILAKFR